MSYSYENQRRQTYGASSRRSALGYWIPLAVTVTVATVGLAAWIWSEREDDESDDYGRRGGARPPRDPPQGPRSEFTGPNDMPHPREEGIHMEEESMVARMSGALRRTPSPQQIFDGASRRVAAGVAAAGAVVGGALSTIREEDKRDFEDHSRWTEEAESRGEGLRNHGSARQPLGGSGPETQTSETSLTRQVNQLGTKAGGKRKTVAIVLSAHAENGNHSEDVAHHEEHAVSKSIEFLPLSSADICIKSILSHLPHHIEAESRVFVLIYAPDLKQHPLDKTAQGPRPPLSITSSYSNIGHEEAQGQEDASGRPLSMIDPAPLPSSPKTAPKSKVFGRLYEQAQSLVDNETMIMPFTTETGHIHLLRHLAPEIVYLQETLSGSNGDVVTNISKWVGQIVLVVGDESGHGGLVDSEDERGHADEKAEEKWWQDDPRIGLGKGVEVVEGLRVGEDWRRRVGGYD